jgi:hypothetical protein
MITLTKDKIVYNNHFNPECDEYIKKEVDRLHPYLNEVVKLSEDITFGDFFKIIEREKDVFDAVFSSHLGHCPLQLYLDEIKKPEVKDDEIDYLEIHRYGEYWDWGDIDMFIGISGISGKSDITYGIGFTPLNELKHLPLRLNEDFEISEVKIPPRSVMYLARLLKKVGIPVGKWDNPSPHVYVKGKVEITVYELISAILNEISFYGDPEKRDDKMDELDRMVDDIKNGDLSNFTKWEE